MAVKIRLRRTGAKGQPSYRLVIADSRSPRDGRFIETIGHYNPRRHDDSGLPELKINADRALYWLDQGATPSDTCRSLLKRARILELRHDRNHGIDVTERLDAMMGRTAEAPEPAAAEPAVAVAEADEAPAAEAAEAEAEADEAEQG